MFLAVAARVCVLTSGCTSGSEGRNVEYTEACWFENAQMHIGGSRHQNRPAEKRFKTIRSALCHVDVDEGWRWQKSNSTFGLARC